MSVMLACRRLKGKDSAGNNFVKYQQWIIVYDLDDDISQIVSDNATNVVVKAFEISLPVFENKRRQNRWKW